ncbi:MAG TPA: hypothetical protein PLU53_09065 [Bacteroidia bacterium]|nr:hypothetical protein [Bacteroidia bacterium]
MKIKGLVPKLTVFTLILLALASCSKDAGEGGTSTISGKVIVYDFDPGFNSPQDTFPAKDEDVYIIYGADHSTYDNDYKTSFDGSYEFKYLQKGQYKLFAYSKDSTGASNGTVNGASPKVPVFVTVEITDKNQTVVAPDIIILKNNQ